jgi:Uma2 family endonuclease
MSTATLGPPVSGEFPPRKKFTREEVNQMEAAGLLAGFRLELIDGDLIDKMGQDPPHAFTIRTMLALLARAFPLDVILVQTPVEAATPDQKWSLPEPDLAVLVEAKQEYRTRFPRGDELLVAIEIADSTVRHDTTKKRDLYARAGVPEYWVVDVNDRKLIVHRHLVQSEYRQITTLAESEEVAVPSRPNATLSVAAMLPPG